MKVARLRLSVRQKCVCLGLCAGALFNDVIGASRNARHTIKVPCGKIKYVILFSNIRLLHKNTKDVFTCSDLRLGESSMF